MTDETIDPADHRINSLGLGPLVQIAYQVDDVGAAARHWARRGAGPFFLIEHIEVGGVRIDGAPGAFDHSSAYGQWGEVMVELIQIHNPGPDRGSSLHSATGRGIHHIAQFADDVASTSAELQTRGCPEVLSAETADGNTFAWFDTRADMGHLLEIYSPTPRLTAFYAMVRDAARGWNGADPVRRR